MDLHSLRKISTNRYSLQGYATACMALHKLGFYSLKERSDFALAQEMPWVGTRYVTFPFREKREILRSFVICYCCSFWLPLLTAPFTLSYSYPLSLSLSLINRYFILLFLLMLFNDYFIITRSNQWLCSAGDC